MHNDVSVVIALHVLFANQCLCADSRKKSIQTAGFIMPYILMILKIFLLPISESDACTSQVEQQETALPWPCYAASTFTSEQLIYFCLFLCFTPRWPTTLDLLGAHLSLCHQR